MYSCIQECVVWLVKWLALFSQSLTLCLLTHNTQCTTYLHYPGCPPRAWHVTAAWISRAYTPFVVCELPDFSWVKERYSSFLSLVVLLPTKEKKKKDKKERKEESKKWQIQRDTQWGIVNQNILSSLFELLCNKLNNKMRCIATPPTQTFLCLVTKSSPNVSATCGKECVTNS